MEPQNEWRLEGKLPPSLFTDNYLLQDCRKNKITVKQFNMIFKDYCSSVDDDTVHNFIAEANISSEFYLKILSCLKEDIGGDGVWLTHGEVAEYQLFDLIEKVNKRRLSESLARYYLMQLLNVLELLHAKSVYYLTLRPEDLGVDHEFNLKLNDYGIPNAIIKCSKECTWIRDISKKNGCISPEILNCNFVSDKSDVFNLGVILFSMVTSFRPFKAMNSTTDYLYRMIEQNDSVRYWKYVTNALKFALSSSFKDLVFKMLTIDVSNRISLEEIKKHPWLEQNEIECKENVSQFFKKTIAARREVKQDKLTGKGNKICMKMKMNDTSYQVE